jgi:hypothetical protein
MSAKSADSALVQVAPFVTLFVWLQALWMGITVSRCHRGKESLEPNLAELPSVVLYSHLILWECLIRSTLASFKFNVHRLPFTPCMPPQFYTANSVIHVPDYDSGAFGCHHMILQSWRLSLPTIRLLHIFLVRMERRLQVFSPATRSREQDRSNRGYDRFVPQASASYPFHVRHFVFIRRFFDPC